MSIYYNMINERAKSNYQGPDLDGISINHYEEYWFPVWFGAAIDIYKELKDEQLLQSADHILSLIYTSAKSVNYTDQVEILFKTKGL